MRQGTQRRGQGVAARVAAVLTLVLAIAAPPARAQTTAEPAPPSWAEGPALTGDWAGVRTRLADRGFAPYATYSIEGFGAAGKGIDDGADWTSVLEFGLDVDAEKLIGLPGGSLHASALWIEGTDPSERVGNLNAISNLSAPAAARLYQLWYKQVLGPATAKIGQVLASDDFMVSAAAALYLNAGFGTYPTFTANINAPTYPLGAPGAVVAWQAAEFLQLQAGVYVADAGPNDAGNTGFGWSTDHGWVVFSEVAYRAKPGGLAGVYKLGGYYDTARFTDLSSGDRDRGNWSLYIMGDQAIHAGAEGAPAVTVFVGAGLSPQEDRNTVHFYAQGGVNVTGLLPPRPKDVLGLAATYTGFSDDFLRANRAARTPVTSQEAIIELTYQAAITPFLILQPDLQYVVDANQSRHNAVVLGIRMVATF